MSSLTIILVVGILVQVVPVTRGQDCGNIDNNSKPVNRSKLEHLYCTLRTLYNTTKHLNSTFTIQLSGSDVINNTKVFEEFSPFCKNFTKAMSLKHHAQEYILNENGPVLDPSQVESYYSMLVSLQTITNIWDDIEFIQHKKRCVMLTATHYEKIYYVDYNGALLDEMTRQVGFWLKEYAFRVPGNIVTCICNKIYPHV